MIWRTPQEDTARAPRITKAVADSRRGLQPERIRRARQGAEPQGAELFPSAHPGGRFLRVRGVFAVFSRGGQNAWLAMDKGGLALVSRRFNLFNGSVFHG